jgi:hypothetical protein
MRTRIALVAIVPIALIIVSILAQAVSAPSAQAETHALSKTRPSQPVVMAPNRLVVYRAHTRGAQPTAPPVLLGALNVALLSDAAAPQSRAPRVPAGVKAVSTTTTTPTPTPTPIAASSDTVTAYQRQAWEQVADCEEGGDWSFNGPIFDGGLGISRANWIAYGGEQFAPEASMATEDQQIMVAERIQAEPPDQDGCSGW